MDNRKDKPLKFVEISDSSELEAIPVGSDVLDQERAVFTKTENGKWQDQMDRAWQKKPKLPAYLILE